MGTIMELFYEISSQISLLQIIALLLVAFLVGLGKSGLSAASLLAVPLCAKIFGAKPSTGIVLMLFLIGDVFAVKAYHQHTDWKKIKQILPPALIGVLIGAMIGQHLSPAAFKMALSIFIFFSLFLMIWQLRPKNQAKHTIKASSSLFAASPKMWIVIPVGLLAGSASMIGNASGPIFAIYLMALGLKKNNFLGTTAWFFFLINLSKMPFQIWLWHNISWKFTFIAFLGIPFVWLGIKIGVKLLSLMDEKKFRFLILSMTAVAALAMIL